MDKKQHLLTRSQLALVVWVALVSPVIRQVPLALVRTAGAGAWLSALLAGLPMLAPALVMKGFLRRRRAGEGLSERICVALGPRLGRLTLLLIVLWLLFFSGYMLRSGADRFVATVYPGSRPGIFIVVMAGLGLMAGLGRLKVLARCAQVAEPILIAIFLLVFVSALPQVDWQALGGVRQIEPQKLAGAAFYAADILSLGVFAALLEGETELGPLGRPLLIPGLLMLTLMVLLCVTVVGMFGAELTEQLYYPFFVLLRNVSFFRLLERVEALVIAQWVVTDFVLLSLLLHGCSVALRHIFGGERRVWAAVSAAAALLAAFLCAPTSFALIHLMERVMPIGNALVTFGLLPLVCVTGLLRRRL